MKENRKLLKEVLKDIQHDMTDEEVLNLLADSKISESPTAEKYTLGLVPDPAVFAAVGRGLVRRADRGCERLLV